MKEKLFILTFSLLLTLIFFMPVNVEAAADFSDIKGHWAEEDIRLLVKKGAISGYSDGTFRPHNSMTRAEFAKLVVRTFDLRATREINSEQFFYNDIYSSNSQGSVNWVHWGLNEIHTATIQGIVQGTGVNEFSPNEPLTREQLAAAVDNLIYKATPFTLQELSQLGLPDVFVLNKFADASSISGWAKSSVNTLMVLKIIEGYNNDHFMPKKAAARAEVVAVLTRLLERSSSQNVTTVFHDLHHENALREDIPLPLEVKEWIKSGETGTHIWHTEDGVYVTVSRFGRTPGYDVSLKRIDTYDDETTVTFEYTYPSSSYLLQPQVQVTPVMVVKIPRTDKVKAVVVE